jgi:hypothetical protein
MTPIDFGVRGSKVKVALTLYFKCVFYQYLDNPLTFKLCRCIAFGQKMTSMDFGVKGSEVKITLTL